MSERPEPTPVALYARVSSDRQDVDLSVAAQLRALRDYAEKNRHVVVREYVDEAESADDTPTGKLLEGIIESVDEFYSENLVWGTAAGDDAEPVRVDRAFSPIVSKALFRRVNARMRSRAPRTIHPRRVGSSYMFSGLVKCNRCKTLLSGQDAKSGSFHYYVCQSLIKRGGGGCDTP